MTVTVMMPVSRSPSGAQDGSAEQQQYGSLQHAGLRMEDVEVEFPMALRLCLGLTAQPDVQLQLVSVRTGCEARQRPASGQRTLPAADSEYHSFNLAEHHFRLRSTCSFSDRAVCGHALGQLAWFLLQVRWCWPKMQPRSGSWACCSQTRQAPGCATWQSLAQSPASSWQAATARRSGGGACGGPPCASTCGRTAHLSKVCRHAGNRNAVRGV